jgi:hypothetical protein
MNGCLNYVEEFMGRSGCGTEMNCIPEDTRITNLTEIPSSESEFKAELVKSTEDAVDKFFETMEKESITAAGCAEAKKNPKDKTVKGTIFGEAKLLGRIAAVKRMERQYNSKVDEISRAKSLAEAEKRCKELYEKATAENSSHSRDEDKEGHWITSYNFEPNLRNCQLTRYEKVCEKSGANKGTIIGKNVAGMGAMGVSAGQGLGPWGAAIGGAVGIAGGVALGIASAKDAGKPECHEVGPIYEDRNI